MTRPAALVIVAVTAVAATTTALAPSVARSQGGRTLEAPAAFDGIRDPATRSAAIFIEAGKVLQHPRCLNCHPAGDRPSQGTGYPHQPPVQRGADGFGVTTMRCPTCHQAANFEPGGVPGSPNWHLAPTSMAWQQRSLGEICAQLKDPTRNGGHGLAEIVEHMSRDRLVGWAWNPGAGREPAPGTQAAFGALIKAWADAGAACPSR
jgi:hypothetical protein